MLTLKLKAGDSLKIGDQIKLVVKDDASRGRLTVGIDAPREINIARVPAAQSQQKKHNI